MAAVRDLRRFTFLTVVVGAVIVVPFVLYRFLYVESQSDYLTGRKFRALDEARGQLATRLSALEPLFRFSEVNELGDVRMLEAALEEATRQVHAARDGVAVSERRFAASGELREHVVDSDASYRDASRSFQDQVDRYVRAREAFYRAEDLLADLEADLRREKSRESHQGYEVAAVYSDVQAMDVATPSCGAPRSNACRIASQGTTVERLRRTFEAEERAFRQVAEEMDEHARGYRRAQTLLRRRKSAHTASARELLARQAELEEKLQRRETARQRLERIRAYMAGLRRTPRYERIEFAIAEGPEAAPWCPAGRTGSDLRFRLEPSAQGARLVAGKCRCVVDERFVESEGVRHCGDAPAEARPAVQLPAITASLPLAGLIDNDSVRAEFDVFLIVDGAGKVLHQTDGGGLRLEALGVRVGRRVAARQGASAPEPDPEKGSAPDVVSGGSMLSYRERLEAAGASYDAYVHPVRVPLMQAGDGEAPHWYTVGLIRRDHFLSQVRSIPVTVWSVFGGGLLLGVLAWPWLKIWLISRTEKLTPSDAFLLTGSGLMGTALVTVGLLDTFVFFEIRREIDATVERIATEMARDFDAELDDLVTTLRRAEFELSCVDFRMKRGEMRADCGDLTRHTERALNAILAENRADRPPLAVARDWSADAEHPIYDVAFRLDHGGTQRGLQLTNRQMSVVKIAVPNRPYFLHARDGPLWPVTRNESGEVEDIYLWRIETYDHGWPLTVVSAAARAYPDDHDDLAAVAMGGRLFSFWEAVLPLTFGFAVVEQDTGKVLYHSDPGRVLVENLLVEVGSDEEVQSLLASDRGGHATTRYRGMAHRFYVKPLAHLPLRLVVFSNVARFEAVNLDLLMTAGGMIFLYLMGLQFGLGLTSRLTRDVAWSWLWPRPEQARRYRQVALALAAALVLLAMLSLSSSGVPLVLAIASTSWIALPFLYLVLDAQGQGEGGRRVRVARGVLVGGLVMLVIATFAFVLQHFELSAWGWLPGTVACGLLTALLRLGWGALCAPQDGPVASSLGAADRLAYVAAGTATLLLLAAVPAAGIFQDALAVHRDRATKLNQLHVQKRVLARRDAIQRDAARLLPDHFAGSRPRARVDLPKKAGCRGVHHYPRFLVANPSPGDVGTCGVRREEAVDCGELGEPSRFDLTVVFARNLPHYGRVSSQTRDGLFPGGDPGVGDPIWVGGRGSYAADAAEIRLCAPGLPGGGVELWYAERLGVPAPEEPSHWAVAGGSVAFALMLLAFIVRSAAVRVLGLDVEDAPPVQAPGLDTAFFQRHHLLIRPPEDFLLKLLARAQEEISVEGVEVHERVALGKEGKRPAQSPLLLMRGKDERSILFVRDLTDLVIEPEYRRRLLDYLEAQAENPLTSIIATSQISPLFRILHPDAFPELSDQEDAASPEECLRWTRLLGTFRKQRFPQEPWSPDVKRHAALLQEECAWSSELRKLVDLDVVERCESEEQALAHIRDVGGGFYRRVWLHLTREERLVLIQLAKGNLANPRNVDVLGDLLRRRLIRRAPDFRIVSESFRRFVLEAEPISRVRVWEEKAGTSAWSTIRLVLLALLALATAILAYSSEEGLNAAVGLVPAIAGAVPLLLRGLDVLQGNKGGS
ncbi:MAG: hypothetical protein ACQGVC_15580 [Myxococcota bacterium]